MSNQKLTDLSPLTSIADGDKLYVVDVSDTTDGAAGTSKYITKLNLVGTTAADLATHIADTTTHGTTGDIVGTSDTQTLTNKTLTTPKIQEILDNDGDTWLKFASVIGTPVNYIQITNSITNNPPSIVVEGTDSNIDMDIRVKGTGQLEITDDNDAEIISFQPQTSAVNEVTVKNAATSAAPEISATGDDTNIDLNLVGKGTGEAKLYNQDDSTYYSAGEFLNDSMLRQAIMNGNFDVWQRGVSFSGPATDSFSADRWRLTYDADGGSFPTRDITREDLTPGDIDNCRYYMSQTFDGAGSSLGVNSFYQQTQRIENGTRYLCGNGKTVTVSFWAKSSIADKQIGLSLTQAYGTGGSPTSGEVITGTQWTLTSSWTKYTHTFTTNTLSGKTFGTSDNDFLQLELWHMWGDTIGDTYGLTGAEDFGGAGDIDIAQVQLCAGSVVLPFQPRSYQQEYLRCLRYYYRMGGQSGIYFGNGRVRTSTQAVIFITFPVALRTTNPTFTTGSTASHLQVEHAATNTACTGVSQVSGTNFTSYVTCTVAAGLTVGHSCQISNNNSAMYLAWDVEL